MDEGFENPDQVVDDFRAMTYTSFDAAPAENEEYTEELPLDERFKRTPVPLLVIFGEEDQLFDAPESIEGYADVPGVQTELIKDAGHAPQVEKPEEVAELLEKFSVPPEIKRVEDQAADEGHIQRRKAKEEPEAAVGPQKPKADEGAEAD